MTVSDIDVTEPCERLVLEAKEAENARTCGSGFVGRTEVKSDTSGFLNRVQMPLYKVLTIHARERHPG